MKPTRSQTSRYSCAPAKKMAATPARQAAVPTEPMSSKVLRPTRSIRDMASMVKQRLVAPMATDWRSPETLLKPARAKMSFK